MDRPTLQNRAHISDVARNYIEKLMFAMKLKRSLHYTVSPSADRSYQPGDLVLIWKEKVGSNRLGEWIGPFAVFGIDFRE